MSTSKSLIADENSSVTQELSNELSGSEARGAGSIEDKRSYGGGNRGARSRMNALLTSILYVQPLDITWFRGSDRHDLPEYHRT